MAAVPIPLAPAWSSTFSFFNKLASKKRFNQQVAYTSGRDEASTMLIPSGIGTACTSGHDTYSAYPPPAVSYTHLRAHET